MSRSPTTWYIGTNLEQKKKAVQFEEGDVRSLTLDYGAYTGIEGTTVSSSSWTILDTAPEITLGTPSTTTKTTTNLVTAVDSGIASVAVTTVFANGETMIHVFQCLIRDPAVDIGTLTDGYSAP